MNFSRMLLGNSLKICLNEEYLFYALSGHIGKVVGSHAAVARLIPTEVALIYTMHEALRSTANEGGGATSKLDLPSLTPLTVAGCG